MSYNIVCFCGGGIRGLLSVTILQILAKSHPNILTKTNLFAGTSTGADIVSLLVAGKTPAEMIQAFLTEETKFFANPSKDPYKPPYSVEAAHHGQVSVHGRKKLNDYKQSVVLTSFNVGSENTPWRPILFSNLEGSPNGDTEIATAVRSSGAMPGMLGSLYGNIDGAFIHHDPTLAAMAMAMNYEQVSLSDMAVICIGTGLMPQWIASDTQAWGAHQWQNGAGNPLDNTPPLLVNGTVAPILNVTLNGTSVSLIPELAGMMLQKNYAYLNPTLAYYIPENDVQPANLEYLQEQANHCDPQQMENALNLLETYWG